MRMEDEDDRHTSVEGWRNNGGSSRIRRREEESEWRQDSAGVWTGPVAHAH